MRLALVVLVACGAPARPEPLGPMHASPGIAAVLVDDGIAAYRQGRLDDAIAKFREAVARDPQPGYFIDLCIAYHATSRLAEAKIACGAVRPGEAPDELAAQARRAITRIEAEGRRRNISTEPPRGDPGPPE